MTLKGRHFSLNHLSETDKQLMPASAIRTLKRIANQGWNDTLRSIHWYFLGGSRYYKRNWKQLTTSHRWCFIVGCNNSGTSLIHRLLRASPEVSTLGGESQLFTRALPRSNRKGHERVWSEYLDDLILDIDASHVGPRLVHDWIYSLRDPVRRVIVLKTPSYAANMPVLQNAFPRCRFIGVVRNGYAVAESILHRGNKSLARAARHWAKVNRLMLEQANHVDDFMLFRFEDLLNDPTDAANRLAAFVEIPPDPLIQAMASGGTRTNLFNSNSIRFSQLSQVDRDIIESEAGDMLQHFGYS
jgi:hypothetical protein